MQFAAPSRSVVSAVVSSHSNAFSTRFIAALLTCLLLGVGARADAATLHVNTLLDNNSAGTLRNQITAAAAGDTIVFDVHGTISLTLGQLLINKGLTITDPTGGITVSGGNLSRVFQISGDPVVMSNLTITGGKVTSDYGGGITNSGNLTLNYCTVSGNLADTSGDNELDGAGGGGIYSNGTLTINNSNLSGNSSSTGGSGNGGFLYNNGTTTITNSTIANNSTSFGGGIFNGSDMVTLNRCTISGNSANAAGGIFTGGFGFATMNMNNCIVAGNTDKYNVPDVYGAITSGGYNLIGKSDGSSGFTAPGDQIGTIGQPLDARLDTLKDTNGGPTATMALLADSPAIDAGAPAYITNASDYDQRGSGHPRVLGGKLDIGAYEYGYNALNSAPVIAANTGLSVLAGATITLTQAMLKATDADGDTLTYTIVTAPTHGTLNLSGAATSTFTQADLAAGNVSYTHTGADFTADRFDFSVSDGEGGSVAAAFAITVENPSLIVTTTSDDSTSTDGLISLREAITYANSNAGADTITFSSLFNSAQTISLGSELPTLTENVTITGPGANLLTISGVNQSFDILTVSDYVSSLLSDLTISNGKDGIFNHDTVTITNCILSGNHIGLWNQGRATATGCTLSGNTYGMWNRFIATATNCTLSGNDTGLRTEGTLTATNCTLSGNDTGLYNRRTATLKNTLVVGNTVDVQGPFTDGGSNITTGTAADAGLDPAGLQDNGGPTQTIAFTTRGTAVNAGDNTLVPADIITDQRGTGHARTMGGTVDIGAYESSFLPPPLLSIDSVTANEGDRGITAFIFTVTRMGDTTASSTVFCNTEAGSAKAGSDYTSTNTTLSFAADETSKTFTVLVKGDKQAEPDETFKVTLINPVNATLVTATGIGTILNDDVNVAPLANAQSIITGENTDADITLSGSDDNGDALTYSVVSAPSYGTLSGTAPDLTYTPTAGYCGADSFNFTVSDGVSSSDTATVYINVIQVNHAPVISTTSLPAARVGDAYSQTVSASDADGDTLSWSVTAGALPSGLTLTGNNGTISGIPTQVGTSNFTIQVNDSNGASDSKSYTFTVRGGASVSLSLSSASPKTKDTLTATPSASGFDGTPTFTYLWKNGTTTLSATGPDLNLSQAGNGDKGDHISVSVTATDGATSASSATATATVINSQPVNVSVSPASGSSASGATRTFTVVVKDDDGQADIGEVWLEANHNFSWSNALCLRYVRSAARLLLRSDDGTAWIGPQPLGTAGGLLTNSQGSLDTRGAAFAATGPDEVTLTLPLVPTAAMGGQNTLWSRVQDAAGATDPAVPAAQSGFVAKGTWSIDALAAGDPNHAPVINSLNPASPSDVVAVQSDGSLLSAPRSFTLTVSDADGAGDLNNLYFQANTRFSWTQSATLFFDVRTSRLFLRSDDGSGWVANGVVGSSGILENTKVQIILSGCSVSRTTMGLSVTLRLRAKGAMLGNASNQVQTLWARVADALGATDPAAPASLNGWREMGSWTLQVRDTSQLNTAPRVVSLTPGALGSTVMDEVGQARSFSVQVSDADGSLDLSQIILQGNDRFSWKDAACVMYDTRTQKLYLRSDDGSTWGTGVALGSGTILSNTQVSVNANQASFTRTAQGGTLNVILVPRSGLLSSSGTAFENGLWVRVNDSAGATDPSTPAAMNGFVTLGKWKVSPPAQAIQSAPLLTPSGGSS